MNSDLKTTQFELLLPVGQKEMALAAIHNGADAIFVGFPGFNARGRSYDHVVSELKEMIELCHLYGVKVNLAFNIVIFEPELNAVIEAIKKILPLKPDALIIQDLGLVNIVRQIAPLQVIHGSTQMTVTNDLAIQFLKDLNIKRFVLGRENSLNEIKLIKKDTDKELEVFVHGALCVSYSGQCFTSESIGGRSANRGQCAQSCRLSYDLIVDGEKINNLNKDYLVSPQDLCGLEEIPELMKIGVNSFKVEGRLKSPEYVASVAHSYKSVMNQTLDDKILKTSEFQKLKNQMAINYSRGFYSGWLHGVNHQKLVDGTFSSHRGSQIGTVLEVNQHYLLIQCDSNLTLNNGDGLLFALEQDPKSPFKKNKNDIEKGGFIFSVIKKENNIYQIGLSNNIKLDSSYLNAIVYLNHDKEQKKEIEKSYHDKNSLKRIPVSYEVSLQLDHPIKLVLTDGYNAVELNSEAHVQLAKTKGVSDEQISEELSALSGTIFKINQIKINRKSSENLFISNKDIKILRQKATEQLTQIRQNNRIDHWDTELNFDFTLIENHNKPTTLEKTKLVVLLRDKSQVLNFSHAVQSHLLKTDFLDSVILDFEFGRDYSDSIQQLKDLKIKVGLATTRILKPQEYQNLKIIKNLNPDFILARNLGAVHYFKNVNLFDKEIRGDFSLNVTNHISADYLFNKGLDSLCVSYDLNADQLNLLIENSNPEKLEITVHQAMPSFHMEHCVFAAFLSKGTSYKDCGKPCEKHKVQLKDQLGNYHWIKPDQECRNTMYNSKSQTALPYLQNWMRQGIKRVRFEALHEQSEDLIKKISTYLQVLEGQMDIQKAKNELQTIEVYGLSSGSLSKDQEYQSRKKQNLNQ